MNRVRERHIEDIEERVTNTLVEKKMRRMKVLSGKFEAEIRECGVV